ncbi:MAG: hypothetical protein ABIE03_06115 [Patescibacteria group bacterium]|nr:hypothetical protein [Patescibacteria group bacterium]
MSKFKTIIFSDIDGIIWPEINTLFALAGKLFPSQRKLLKVENFTTITGKTEQNTPPLLLSHMLNKIFRIYEKLRIFQYPLEELENTMNKHFGPGIKINVHGSTDRIKSLKKLSKKNNVNLEFITRRYNYQNVSNIQADTKRFNSHYGLPLQIHFSNKKFSKGHIINKIRAKKENSKIKQVIILEDNLAEILKIRTELKKQNLTTKFFLIRYPWNSITKKNIQELKTFIKPLGLKLIKTTPSLLVLKDSKPLTIYLIDKISEISI